MLVKRAFIFSCTIRLGTFCILDILGSCRALCWPFL